MTSTWLSTYLLIEINYIYFHIALLRAWKIERWYVAGRKAKVIGFVRRAMEIFDSTIGSYPAINRRYFDIAPSDNDRLLQIRKEIFTFNNAQEPTRKGKKSITGAKSYLIKKAPEGVAG